MLTCGALLPNTEADKFIPMAEVLSAMQADLAPRAGVGAALRRAREARGLSLNDVAQTTRIQARYLRALEEDAPEDDFPGQVYARFFLREYARSLELDDAALMTMLDARVKRQAPRIEPIRELVAPRRWAHRLMTILALGLLIGLVAASVANSRLGERGLRDVGPPVVAAPAHHPKEAGVRYGRDDVPIVASIRVDATTFVQVISDGERDIKRWVGAGEVLRSVASSTMQVIVDDPEAVQLRVNGQPIEATADVLRARFASERGRVVRV
jgi:transcriptional regulator with XRE-family HTH domain